MKKILVVIITFILFSFTNVIADDDRYGEWSTEKYDYPGEQTKHEYGYRLPLTYTEFTPIMRAGADNMYYYRIMPYPFYIEEGYDVWYSLQPQTLYTWPMEGELSFAKRLLGWDIDIEAVSSYDDSYSSKYEPKMELVCTLADDREVVVASTPGRGGNERNMSFNLVEDNPEPVYECKKVKLNMVEQIPTNGDYSKIDKIVSHNSVVLLNSECFSFVETWSEGTDWREERPYARNGPWDRWFLPCERDLYRYPLYYYISYELNGGAFSDEYPTIYYPENDTNLPEPYKEGYIFVGFHLNEDYSDRAFKKIERGIRGDITLYAEYKHKAPEIDVERKYIYEDEDIEDIKDLASAYDEVDGDISDQIIIEKIFYDDQGSEIEYPSEFDSTLSDNITVIYYVENSEGSETRKEVKLHILKSGEFINLNIYDRYISKEYTNTLENNSIWKNEEYYSKLDEAFEWLERK